MQHPRGSVARVFVLGLLFSSLASSEANDLNFEFFGEQTNIDGWADPSWQKHVCTQIRDIKPHLVVFDPGHRSAHDTYSVSSVCDFMTHVCESQLQQGQHILIVDAAYTKRWDAPFVRSLLDTPNSLTKEICMLLSLIHI